MSSPIRYRIRQARLEDLGKVSQLERRVWHRLAAPREAIQRRFFLFPQGFQVAEVELEIAGVCCGVRIDVDLDSDHVDEYYPPRHVPSGEIYVLYDLTVNPIYRRHGIGTRLIKKHLKLARDSGCRKVQLVANAVSRSTFQRLKFEVTGELDHLFRDFPDVMREPVLMERKPG